MQRKWFSLGLALALALPVAVRAQEEGDAELSDADKALMAKIRELGGQVLELAQNDTRLTVAFHLADGKVDDSHVEAIAGSGNVYSLNLRGTEVTDASAEKIATLSGLVRLHLEKTKIYIGKTFRSELANDE